MRRLSSCRLLSELLNHHKCLYAYMYFVYYPLRPASHRVISLCYSSFYFLPPSFIRSLLFSSSLLFFPPHYLSRHIKSHSTSGGVASQRVSVHYTTSHRIGIVALSWHRIVSASCSVHFCSLYLSLSPCSSSFLSLALPIILQLASHALRFTLPSVAVRNITIRFQKITDPAANNELKK